MKNIKEYIKESNEKIPTKEVINILKKGGETPNEIKKDVSVNQSTMSYPDFINVFIKKCYEWYKIFNETHQKIKQSEGSDYLIRNLGEKWYSYFIESINDFQKSLKELAHQRDNITESFQIRQFDNYKSFYNYLSMINEFNNKVETFEKTIDTSKYEDLLKARIKVSDSIRKIFKAGEHFKQFLDVIYKYINNRI